MMHLGKQIPLGLLLGFLLVTQYVAAQEPGILPSGGSNGTAAVLVVGSHGSHGSVAEAPPASTGQFFSTQFRNWDEPSVYMPNGESTPAAVRPAPYVDSCFDCPDDMPWFFEGGPIALQRIRWEGGSLITRDGNTLTSKDELDSRLEWGGRFSVGKRCWDCSELEFTGFTLPDMNVASAGRGPFNVNLPVFNPPPGFDDFGNDSSLIAVNYQTDMSGFEVLWRRWNLFGCNDPCCGTSCPSGTVCPVSGGLELGLRYLNIDEQFSVYSQFGALPDPNGLQDYRYRTSADNHIIGPELGIQLRSCPWLGFDILFCSRLTLAANFVETSASLRELSSLVAFDKDRDEVSFTQVFDNSIYLRLRPGHHIDVRAGYQLLWVNGYAGASDQISSNLGRPGRFDDNNGILFQGPAMLVQINF